jgi:hypothetical protein
MRDGRFEWLSGPAIAPQSKNQTRASYPTSVRSKLCWLVCQNIARVSFGKIPSSAQKFGIVGKTSVLRQKKNVANQDTHFGEGPLLSASRLGSLVLLACAYSSDADHSFRFDGDHYSE